MQLFSYLKNGSKRFGRLIGLLGVDITLAVSAYGKENPRALLIDPKTFDGIDEFSSLSEEQFPIIEEVTNWVMGLPQDSPVLHNNKEMLFEYSSVTLLSPIHKPGKVICIGGNYPSSIEDHGPEYPTVFLKPSSGVAADQAEIPLPVIANDVRCEVELAVVIGKKGRNLNFEEAHNIILGYTLANDLGDHNIEKRTSQWTSGKMFDAFTPIGPILITPNEMRNLDDLLLYTKVNGETVQRGSTRQMFFDVPYLVSYLSTLTTLEPGDVILTGSPKMIHWQPNPDYSLKPGDAIEIGIENQFSLWNKVVKEGV
jgi:acylpyruvate hydrolase